MNTLKSYLMTPRDEIENTLRDMRLSTAKLRKIRARLLSCSAMLMVLFWFLMVLGVR